MKIGEAAANSRGGASKMRRRIKRLQFLMHILVNWHGKVISPQWNHQLKVCRLEQDKCRVRVRKAVFLEESKLDNFMYAPVLDSGKSSSMIRLLVCARVDEWILIIGCLSERALIGSRLMDACTALLFRTIVPWMDFKCFGQDICTLSWIGRQITMASLSNIRAPHRS